MDALLIGGTATNRPELVASDPVSAAAFQLDGGISETGTCARVTISRL